MGCVSLGSGRKPLTQSDPTLLTDLESLVEPVTRGDPESPLRWTTKSMVKLAQELQQMGPSEPTQCLSVMGELGYSLQSHRKTTEGKQHEDRDVQFQHINETVEQFQQRQPVISVDAKKRN